MGGGRQQTQSIPQGNKQRQVSVSRVRILITDKQVLEGIGNGSLAHADISIT